MLSHDVGPAFSPVATHSGGLAWWRRAAVLVVLAWLAATACSPGGDEAGPRTAPDTPYAQLQTREIKALDPQKVRQLLDGEGAGYALAAELNHYPGPRHVLELAPRLGLRADQEHAVRELFAAMEAEAKRLGRQMVDLETQLDQAFAARTVTHDEVARLTSEAAAVEAGLRAVHLSAHLRTVEVLTPEQVRRYNELRGYTGTGGADGEKHGGHRHEEQPESDRS